MSIQRIEQELEKMKRVTTEPDNTDPFKDNTNNNNDFPIDVLPEAIKNMCRAGSYAIGMPVEFFAVPALVAVASAIGAKAEVKLDEKMSTGASLFAVLIANASSGKSPAQDMAFAPINHFHKESIQEFNQKYSEYKQKLDEYKEHKKKSRSKKNQNEFEEELLEPEAPVLKKLYTTDTTVEALAELLKSNPNGICLKVDEFLSFYEGLNQYKKGDSDKNFYLSLWNQKQIDISRKGQPSLYIDRPYICISGNMTPSGINAISGDSNQENGFLDRLLFAWPTETGMFLHKKAKADKNTEQEYHKLIESLLNYSINGVEKIELSNEAYDEYHKYNLMLHKDAGKNDKKSSIYGKILMYSLRFALIIHICETVNQDVFDKERYITARTFKRAIQIAEYFRGQTKKIYKSLNESEYDKNFKRAIEIIKNHQKNETISRRDIQMNMKGLKGNDLTEFLGLLEEKQVIKFKEEVPVGGSKKIIYQVNPNFLNE